MSKDKSNDNLLTVKDKDGNDVVLKVIMPTLAHRNGADDVRNKTFRRAVQNGAFLSMELDNVLRERGFWNDERQAEVTALQKKIDDGCQRLAEGGFDIWEARQLAIEIGDWRMELVGKTAIRSQMAALTAEGQAEDKAFDYLVSRCLVYNDTGKPYFPTFDAYLESKNNADDIPELGLRQLSRLLYGQINEEALKKLPENAFLLEFKFVNDDLEFIDKDGRSVNRAGKPVEQTTDDTVTKVRKPFLNVD